MPDLKAMLRQARKGNPLIVTAEHSQWLAMPEEARYALMEERHDEVMIVMEKLIFGRGKVPRGGRIGASGLGGCLRKQLFSYAGAPKLGEDPDSEDLMSMGTHDHMWWQIEGIVMGWLADVEPYVHNNVFGGSLDGWGTEVGPFELKTVRDQKYTRIVQIDDTPLEEHLIQFDFYMDQMDAEAGSMVYQERGGGAYNEYRIHRIPAITRKRERIQERLLEHIHNDDLPDMLEDCEMKMGYVYKQCPYRKYCPSATGVTLRS